MKLLLENWRKYLNEAAKGFKDLPENSEVNLESNEDGFYFELTVDNKEIGSIEALKMSECGEVFSVTHVEADHGWGPFLYDLAMEHASLIGSGLTSDKNHISSEDALNIWEYYYNNRGDVEKTALPKNCPIGKVRTTKDNMVKVIDAPESMRVAYIKRPDNTLTNLIHGGYLNESIKS